MPIQESPNRTIHDPPRAHHLSSAGRDQATIRRRRRASGVALADPGRAADAQHFCAVDPLQRAARALGLWWKPGPQGSTASCGDHASAANGAWPRRSPAESCAPTRHGPSHKLRVRLIGADPPTRASDQLLDLLHEGIGQRPPVPRPRRRRATRRLAHRDPMRHRLVIAPDQHRHLPKRTVK